MLLTLLESTATTAKWIVLGYLHCNLSRIHVVTDHPSTEEAEEADGRSAQGNGTG